MASFAQSLRQLRAGAGTPSYRELARLAMFAPSVLSTAASGFSFPSLRITLAYVGACGGNAGEWRSRWEATAAALAVPAPGPEAAGAALPHAADRSGPRQVTPVLLRPSQLPAAPAYYTGRTDELAHLLALTDPENPSRAAAIAINGPVGIGKTALALALAHRAASDYPDGQLHADLAMTRADGQSVHTLIERLLSALGLGSAEIPADPQHRVGLYRSVLATRRVLVLFDNADSEAEIRPLLAAGPSSLVGVTSRRRLTGLDNARRIMLDVLPPDDSRALAAAVLGDGEAHAASRAAMLGEMCGHLPLAVWIAATRLADHHVRTPPEVPGQLMPSGLLDWLATGDVSLRGRLRSAYRQLDRSARRAFRRLGLATSRDVGTIQIRTMLGMPAVAADRALETLVDAGLLQPSPIMAGYRIPALFGFFAQELLAKWEPANAPALARRRSG